MSRIIKFRGKRIDNGKWIYGDLHHGKIAVGKVFIDGHEVIGDTVGQYINSMDSNGKEIYEGDNVAFCMGEEYQGNWEYASSVVIKSIDDYDAIGWISNAVRVDIDGNIHDNPELFKEE